MDTKKVKNYDADEGIAGKNMTSTVSATEATGMMYDPPHDREELSALRDMHQLQATEFAAAQYGVNEPAYPHERRTANAGYGKASGGSPERHSGSDKHYGESEHREGYGAAGHQPPEDRGRRGKKKHENPAKFNPELAKVDPDINCVNGHDDRHASLHPMSAVDWANGESVKY